MLGEMAPSRRVRVIGENGFPSSNQRMPSFILPASVIMD
jgi:hypothetical protein